MLSWRDGAIFRQSGDMKLDDRVDAITLRLGHGDVRHGERGGDKIRVLNAQGATIGQVNRERDEGGSVQQFEHTLFHVWKIAGDRGWRTQKGRPLASAPTARGSRSRASVGADT